MQRQECMGAPQQVYVNGRQARDRARTLSSLMPRRAVTGAAVCESIYPLAAVFERRPVDSAGLPVYE